MTANGGPQPQSSIEYSISNATVGSVTQAGLFTAEELGVTKVIGRAVGNTGGDNTVVYSEVRDSLELDNDSLFTVLKLLSLSWE